ncbi:MAG: lamin tail domain-containing protein [Candidatus Berkelbacteria bacterium]|nr:lamin tail domain-containing protein [Candidatus Berkelbacteria bacterium]MCR4307025.1 lamin tail domain-containing protein [Candidatus Berkelbacteria bacterium]
MNKIQIFLVRFLVVLLALQGTVAAQLLTIKSAQAADPVPAVVINELMWMGTDTSTADEWIELRNTTGASIDLSGWQLTHAAPSNGTLTIPAGNSIEANGYFLISNYSETATTSILDVAPDWVTTSISLVKNCEAGTAVYMKLQNPFPTDPPTVIDSAGCGSAGGSPLAGSDLAVKKAMERNVVITDGLLVTSWHDSASHTNLDLGAVDFASPRATNESDLTPPIGGIVNDGAGVDIDWSANTAQITVNWSGFTDPESGITDYMVGLGTTPTAADFSPFSSVGNVLTKTILFPSATTTGTFYTLIKPVNGTGIVGAIKASDGFTIDILNPATPTGLAVIDMPSDNGGSLKATWTASTSIDDVTYQLNYRELGIATWTSVVTGSALEKVVSGLFNDPIDYQFTVESIDFNAQHSAPSAIVTATALDNLVPVIDANKVVVNQNKPGTADTVAGLAGAANEPEVAVALLSAAPEDPTATLIGGVLSNPDGSWPAIGIGDNIYSQVWLVLIDEGDNTSLPLKLTNDIVGPTAPILIKAVANCESATCRVTLDWQAGSTDTASYKVQYTVDGVTTTTFEVTTTSMALDLMSGKSYLFKIVGYDQYGNPSLESNVFSIALTKGVKTTVTGSGTTTEGISGSTEVKTAPVSAPKPAPAQFVPKVKAAEPVVETPTAPNPPLVADTENSRDWVRILVVVVLLLIIAGSFYALSRSVQETPEEEFDRNKAESKGDAAAGTARRRRHRRNRRK